MYVLLPLYNMARQKESPRILWSLCGRAMPALTDLIALLVVNLGATIGRPFPPQRL